MSPGQQKAMQSMAVLRGDSTNLPKSGFWGVFLDAADSPLGGAGGGGRERFLAEFLEEEISKREVCLNKLKC